MGQIAIPSTGGGSRREYASMRWAYGSTATFELKAGDIIVLQDYNGTGADQMSISPSGSTYVSVIISCAYSKSFKIKVDGTYKVSGGSYQDNTLLYPAGSKL